MNKRILKIKEYMKKQSVDCYIVYSASDVRYFSNLVSSNIMLLITNDKSYVFSDARYKFVIENQKLFEPVCIDKPILKCVCEKIEELSLKTVLADPTHFNYKDFSYLMEKFNVKCVEGITKELRIVKEKEEKENIIKAQRIAEKAYEEVLKDVKVGVTTMEIASKLDYLMKKYGSSEVAFDTIVVSGGNSANCHGVPDDTKIGRGDALLFDFGATYNGYRSDMTRTVFVEEIKEEYKKLYKIVLDAHFKAAGFLKPGIPAKEVDMVVREHFEKCGYLDNYLHSLGHGVGIDIHEYPTLSYKSEEILKEGMVVTIEPGLYFKNKFGIRIEDTYIITKNGCESIAKTDKSIIIV